MRKNIQKIQAKKAENKKITALTAYDYSSAKYVDEAGIDIILVGDSVGQVVLGYDDTTSVSMDEMKIFTSAVSRAVEHALLVADMPFGSFQIGVEEAMKNAIELIKAGANAVKLEGSSDYVIKVIKHLTQNGVPVMGHLGYTPMNINTIGGHKVQGKDAQTTLNILKEAIKLQDAGCFSVVLEMVPMHSSQFITERLLIPTIGIGAGKYCDGQILVLDDIIGKYDRFKPKFARRYADNKELILNAVKSYCKDVEEGTFPTVEESFELEYEEVRKLEDYR